MILVSPCSSLESSMFIVMSSVTKWQLTTQPEARNFHVLTVLPRPRDFPTKQPETKNCPPFTVVPQPRDFLTVNSETKELPSLDRLASASRPPQQPLKKFQDRCSKALQNDIRAAGTSLDSVKKRARESPYAVSHQSPVTSHRLLVTSHL